MKKIIFATGNQNKMKEIREILADMDVEVVSMKEAGIHADIVEDGNSFEENAEIKAKTICEMTGEITLADDSGLEIDYLNKEPGIYSARYMGEDTSYRIKNGNLIQRLEGVPDEKRTARFVCAVAAAFPDGTVKTVRETMEGRIGYEEKGCCFCACISAISPSVAYVTVILERTNKPANSNEIIFFFINKSPFKFF